MKKLVLIDSNALVHRAFHALPPTMTSPSGDMTNAVYGFTSVLLKMIADLKPDYMAATFDLAGPTFRHTEYEAYKAHRTKAPDELYAQIPVVKRMLAALGVPVYEQAGFEADDVIGTISAQTGALPDVQTIIVTGDLDTLQLVRGNTVVVFTLRKGMTDTITYDEDAVRERFGLAPAQVADFKGLKGDPSDNIPGVSGIGDMTASKLIGTFGSIEALYEELEKPSFAEHATTKGISEKLRAKLLEQHDMALFSKKLATIVRDVPVSFDIAQTDWRQHIRQDQLTTLCQELGFFSLVKRISSVLNGAVSAAAAQTLDLDGAQPASATVEHIVGTVTDMPDAPLAAVSVRWATDGTAEQLWVSTDGATVFSIPKPSEAHVSALMAKYPRIAGHGLKPLLKILAESGAPKALLTDTLIAAWLLNPDQRDYSLGRLVYDELGKQLPDAPPDAALAVWHLAHALDGKLTTLGLGSVFNDIEMPLVGILAEMEQRGILIDRSVLDVLATEASAQVASLERRIYDQAGTEFNINSPAQLSDVLFTRLAIKGRVRRTGGGALSTAASELEKLRDEHPIIESILEYRELSKLKTTYIDPFPSLIAADGRIRTTYNQTGTATGRLSSSDPNLQNIPTRTELGQRFRAAFVAPKGMQLLSLDYSQLELRLVAHIAKDEVMGEAFRNGEDIHTRTASEVFGLAPGQVTKDMRRQAKVLNFGIIYGMGTLGFARAAGISRDAAKHFIEEYFARFAGVARYMEHTKDAAFRDGYVTTLLGRRRTLPDVTSRIPQLAAQAERMAINHPIQGTGADLMKLAMIAVRRHLAQRGLTNAVRMLLQVHDELVFEVPDAQVGPMAAELGALMEGVLLLDVPIIVDAKAGPSWAHQVPLTNST